MNGEIISLQFGNYSNFVGTQFFNLQNPNEQDTDASVDYGVWWQEHRQGTSKIYSPRLVAVDLGENCVLKGLTQGLGQEASAKNNVQLWDGKVEEINVGPDGDAPVQNASVGQVEPRKFEDGRDGWTDLCRWRIRHGQIQTIPNFSHNPEKKGLSSYSQGLEIWRAMEENLSDQIRKYAEECDHLQGFHVLVDQDDGISGVCGGILQHLSDEYESKCCFGIGVSPPHLHLSGSKDTNFKNKIANVALLWNRFNHHATAFSSMSLSSNIFSVQSRPRNIPLWRYKAESVYESSAVLAATLHNIWAPISTTSSSAVTTLPEVSSFLSTFGRKMASICSSFPFPCDIRNDSLFGILKEKGLSSHLSLTTCLSSLNFEKASGNFYVLKGFPDEIAITEKERAGLIGWQQSMIKDINSCFTVFAQDSFSKSVNLVRSVKNATTVRYPFPTNAIIPSALEWNYVKRNYTRGVLDVWDLPSIASAHNTSQNGIVVDSAVREVGGDNTRKVHSFHTTCNMDIELDDFVQCIEDLSTLKEQYEEKYE